MNVLRSVNLVRMSVLHLDACPISSHIKKIKIFLYRNGGGEGSKQGARNGGKGDGWLDVKPQRRKALRQGDRGQDRLRTVKQFRDREDHGLQQGKSRTRSDSRDGRFDNDVGYGQQVSDWYDGESVGDERSYYDSGYDLEWQRSRRFRRGNVFERLGINGNRIRTRTLLLTLIRIPDLYSAGL